MGINDMGNIVCVVIPYKSFKEKIRITKEYSKYNIEVYKNYILVNIYKGGSIDE